MNIIFDLDGTLIDSSERMYRLFCDLIPSCGLTKDEYWGYKRNKANHKKLIEILYPEIKFEEFQKIWFLRIEEKRYLEMDCLYKDTQEVLDNLCQSHKIFLLTARQLKYNLLWELDKLGLGGYFEDIFVTEGKRGKDDVLDEKFRYLPLLAGNANFFVSDMGEDILLGKKMGCRTVGITHGFMSGKRLQKYEPDYLIGELSELLLLM